MTCTAMDKFIIMKKSTVAPSNLNFTLFVGVNVLSHLSKFYKDSIYKS